MNSFLAKLYLSLVLTSLLPLIAFCDDSGFNFDQEFAPEPELDFPLDPNLPEIEAPPHPGSPAPELNPATRPNLLLIISDDQRSDFFNQQIMPKVFGKIVSQGINFERAYVTTPACCPSRATIFTGQYASRHKVIGNRYTLDKPTFMPELHKNGYHTAFIGKYLNTHNGEPLPGYDYWVGRPGGSAKFFNPALNINGKWAKVKGYSTTIFENYALDFLRANNQTDKPFALILSPNAPHYPALPEPSTLNLFSDLKRLRPAGYMKSNLPGKPSWVRRNKKSSKKLTSFLDQFRIRQLQTLRSLDRSVGSILDYLESSGKLENTLVIFYSDNGLMYGEFKLTEKDCAYEPVVKVPLAIRYSPLTADKNTKNSNLVANIDFAPTIFDLLNIKSDLSFDGKSLVPLLAGENPVWREEILLESWKIGRKSHRSRLPFSALVSNQYKFIRNYSDPDELYDLTRDPGELKNLRNDLRYRHLLQHYNNRLDSILLEVRGTTSFDSPLGNRTKVKIHEPKIPKL